MLWIAQSKGLARHKLRCRSGAGAVEEWRAAIVFPNFRQALRSLPFSCTSLARTTQIGMVFCRLEQTQNRSGSRATNSGRPPPL